jgi:hypothetical protein
MRRIDARWDVTGVTSLYLSAKTSPGALLIEIAMNMDHALVWPHTKHRISVTSSTKPNPASTIGLWNELSFDALPNLERHNSFRLNHYHPLS